MKKIPVLFIIFNRPELALNTFKVIKTYQPEVLYIAADGPRKEKTGEKEICEKTREYILDQIDWTCKVHKLFRDQNIGCGLGVSNAISWMFKKELYGIILEDDCIPSLDFFRFCEELLPKYVDNDKIMQINGYNPNSHTSIGNSYSFSRYPKIWGWATWKRAWNQFDLKMIEWPNYRDSGKMKTQFPILERWIHLYVWNKYYKEVNEVLKPRAWDIPWSVTIFSQDGLCIVPDINLVVNTGEGIYATNCYVIDPIVSKQKYGNLCGNMIHPSNIELTYFTNHLDSKSFINRKIRIRLLKIKQIFTLKRK